jgi:hypothetical protein
MNLDKIIVYGYTLGKTFHTHSFIHQGFFRAARFLYPDSLWLDQTDDLSGIDLKNTLFITEHAAAMNLPIRDDCFYVVHGLNDNPPARQKFSSVGNRLSWNVYHDYSHVYGTQGNPVNDHVIGVPLTDVMWIGEEVPLYPKEHHMDFRWATDLLPHEIEALKPDHILGIGSGKPGWSAREVPDASKVIWWVGTQCWVNLRELTQFKKACDQDGVEFKAVGAGQNGIISIEDNIRLVRESYFAPTIVGSHHITEGYAPCRIFKNISYGQMGVTNSLRVHQLFGEALIYHPDPYLLFFEARDRLRTMDVKHLHMLMDMVAAKHTYINRINSILKAARIIMESK